jgi:hypothetical protein
VPEVNGDGLRRLRLSTINHLLSRVGHVIGECDLKISRSLLYYDEGFQQKIFVGKNLNNFASARRLILSIDFALNT